MIHLFCHSKKKLTLTNKNLLKVIHISVNIIHRLHNLYLFLTVMKLQFVRDINLLF